MKNVKRTVYTDPGHGWLKVSVQELQDLGIIHAISEYSYLHGHNAYLEEDCDAQAYLDAMYLDGKEVQFVDKHTDNTSRIRKYRMYSVEEALEIMKGDE
jgi:hypothetical protein